eukprot:TRINITY_DN730_c1_g1_i1.p1 TRINITY_DN730_c1_g1~~TRINITY_DN730_c1_g1_i1.p1  ORF type:complete len:635 (+),score=108.28 TRINITY_DN730_c1_g1_i1:83-1987(+)
MLGFGPPPRQMSSMFDLDVDCSIGEDLRENIAEFNCTFCSKHALRNMLCAQSPFGGDVEAIVDCIRISAVAVVRSRPYVLRAVRRHLSAAKTVKAFFMRVKRNREEVFRIILEKWIAHEILTKERNRQKVAVAHRTADTARARHAVVAYQKCFIPIDIKKKSIALAYLRTRKQFVTRLREWTAKHEQLQLQLSAAKRSLARYAVLELDPKSELLTLSEQQETVAELEEELLALTVLKPTFTSDSIKLSELVILADETMVDREEKARLAAAKEGDEHGLKSMMKKRGHAFVRQRKKPDLNKRSVSAHNRSFLKPKTVLIPKQPTQLQQQQQQQQARSYTQEYVTLEITNPEDWVKCRGYTVIAYGDGAERKGAARGLRVVNVGGFETGDDDDTTRELTSGTVTFVRNVLRREVKPDAESNSWLQTEFGDRISTSSSEPSPVAFRSFNRKPNFLDEPSYRPANPRHWVILNKSDITCVLVCVAGCVDFPKADDPPPTPMRRRASTRHAPTTFEPQLSPIRVRLGHGVSLQDPSATLPLNLSSPLSSLKGMRYRSLPTRQPKWTPPRLLERPLRKLGALFTPEDAWMLLRQAKEEEPVCSQPPKSAFIPLLRPPAFPDRKLQKIVDVYYGDADERSV